MPTVLSDMLRFGVAKASDMVQVAFYAIHPCGFHTIGFFIRSDHVIIGIVLGFIDSGYHCPATFADESGKNSVRQHNAYDCWSHGLQVKYRFLLSRE